MPSQRWLDSEFNVYNLGVSYFDHRPYMIFIHYNVPRNLDIELR